MSVSTSLKPLLSDTAYARLKYCVTIVLPALTGLYIAVGQVWGFKYIDPVVATITALNVFAGAVLHLSSTVYNKTQAGSTDGSYADLVVSPSEGTYLSFNGDPSQLQALKKVTLNVVNTDK